LELILLLILLGLSAALSGSETAFFSLSQTDIAQLAQNRGRAGRLVANILGRATDLLSALLIGNLLINTAASVVASALCLKLFGDRGLAVAIPATTLALLLVGEITPKMLALRFRKQVALIALVPLRGWLILIGPVLRLISLVMGAVVRALPLEATGDRPLSTEEMQAACDLAVEEGTLTETEGRSLARLLRLDDLEVARIMTPRTAVVALRREMSLKTVLATARRAGFNRYPVLAEDGLRPEGLFHLKDLLNSGNENDQPVAGALRPLLFVPESKDVAGLLADMRQGAGHLAAVVDEHGDFTGIVTMADCLQALLGPGADTAEGDAGIMALGDGRWVFGGRTGLRELEEATGLRLPESRDYVTVAGFLMTTLSRVLEPGDRVTLPEGRLTVLEMTGHRVESIKLTLLGPASRGGAPGGES